MHGFVGVCGCVLWVLVALSVLCWVLVRLCWLGGGRCVGFFALLLVGDLLAGTGFGTCVCGNVCCVGLLAGSLLEGCVCVY